jgi:hypothetical protein
MRRMSLQSISADPSKSFYFYFVWQVYSQGMILRCKSKIGPIPYPVSLETSCSVYVDMQY